ncbi:Transposase and inactivated derivatives, IS30 family [Microbulbifer thermotolerans]|uniref:IS30 family transposase n=4 Tax=Microbulbifer thermotolerans TaxID=252514 RepID=UPI0008EE9070|nr:IS30 family transposase [Microbulbifer thermotolerans]SFD19355.1 Transposase and inactivated derivatives, IS30 family [Microbulbifer thermotolerans]
MNYNQLTENERYQIYSLKTAGHSQVEIAKNLGRHPSTISRELRRNAGQRGYRPGQAQKFSDTRRHEAYKARKITGEVRGQIEVLIRQELSPQQVVSYLERHTGVSLHHETIYQLIYADKISGGDLYTHLRIASKPYRKRYGSRDRRGRIKNRVSIEERPAIVERCGRVGDWEGDTIIGKGRKGALLTMVERKTLYTVIVRLTGKKADLLASAAVDHMIHLKDKIKTITFDNGLEFAEHGVIAKGLDADIYFAHPYASWERGINENTNGLIRQYFPKDTDFTKVTDEEVQFVMERLNGRPRASRGGRSPNELFMGQRDDLLAA